MRGMHPTGHAHPVAISAISNRFEILNVAISVKLTYSPE